MFKFFKSIFNKNCHLCKSKEGYFSKYEIKGQKVNVCRKCLEYAERRAFRKV